MRMLAIAAAALAAGCYAHSSAGNSVAGGAIVGAAAIAAYAIDSETSRPPEPMCRDGEIDPPHTCPAQAPQTPR